MVEANVAVQIDESCFTNQQLLEEVKKRDLDVTHLLSHDDIYDAVVEMGIDIPPLEERKRTLLDEVKMDIVESGIHNKSLAELEAFFK